MNPRRKPICALAPVGRLRPRLFVEHAVALVITGRTDDAEPLLREAERAAEVDGEDGRFLLGFASTVLSWRVHLRGNAPEAVELARRALSLLPEGDVHVRNYAAVRLGDALGSVGDLAAADEAYAEAAEIGRAPRLREARGHGDARQGAGRAGPPAGASSNISSETLYDSGPTTQLIK